MSLSEAGALHNGQSPCFSTHSTMTIRSKECEQPDRIIGYCMISCVMGQ